MQKITLLLPEYLAPYLINGDCTLSPGDQIKMDKLKENYKLGACLSMADTEGFFSWHNDFDILGATVNYFTFIII